MPGFYHAGTYVGNPLSLTAGLITLRDILTREFLDAHLMRLPTPEELAEFKAFRVEVDGIKDEERKTKSVNRKTLVYELQTKLDFMLGGRGR
jgi:glutamate-1-semialdehyde aminotransferase